MMGTDMRTRKTLPPHDFHSMSTKSHKTSEDTETKEEGRALNPGAAESPREKAHPTSADKSGPKPVPSPGKAVYDISSHKITELFDSKDVVFVRENGAMELYPIPAHEAETRFIEIDGKVESKFNTQESREEKFFKLKDGRAVNQQGGKTSITDKDGRVSTAGPTLHIHDTAVQA